MAIYTHGIGAYNAGCRCEICRTAKSQKRKQYQSAEAKEREREHKKNVTALPENKKQKSAYDKDRHALRYNSEDHRWRRIKRIYNLTKEQYESMMALQNNVCAICNKKPGRAYLAVDHDHSCCASGKTCGNCVRGLLCGACNAFIGRINENPSRLLEYFKKWH